MTHITVRRALDLAKRTGAIVTKTSPGVRGPELALSLNALAAGRYFGRTDDLGGPAGAGEVGLGEMTKFALQGGFFNGDHTSYQYGMTRVSEAAALTRGHFL
jgi:hypothetical protein